MKSWELFFLLHDEELRSTSEIIRTALLFFLIILLILKALVVLTLLSGSVPGCSKSKLVVSFGDWTFNRATSVAAKGPT